MKKSIIETKELPWVDTEDTALINYVIPLLPSEPIILEAGACSGDDTQSFKKIWPDCTIYAFEPHPVHYKELLRRKIDKMSNVHLYNFALSDTEGMQTFYMSKKVPGASSLLEDNFKNIEIPEQILRSVDTTKEDAGYQDDPTTVPCRKLSSWAEQEKVKKIDFFWIDVEGSELRLLANAGPVLDTAKVILVEANFKEFRKGGALFDDVYAFLSDKGFHLEYINGNPSWQGNCIFIRK